MTPSINEQLNIPILPNGTKTYQPALFGGDLEDSGFNDRIVVGTAYYSRADGKKNGWANCCGNFTGEQDYNYATGADLDECLGGCGDRPASPPSFLLSANPQLKAIYNAKVATWDKCIKNCTDSVEEKPITNNRSNSENTNTIPKPNESSASNSPKKMSTAMIVGLSIGGLVLIGGIIYLVKMNKAKK